MKVKRATLAKPQHVGAIGAMVEYIDPPGRHPGVDLVLDPKTLLLSVFKGDQVSLVRDWASLDLADVQEDDTDAGTAGGVQGKAPRRGRPPKVPPPVST